MRNLCLTIIRSFTIGPTKETPVLSVPVCGRQMDFCFVHPSLQMFSWRNCVLVMDLWKVSTSIFILSNTIKTLGWALTIARLPCAADR